MQPRSRRNDTNGYPVNHSNVNRNLRDENLDNNEMVQNGIRRSNRDWEAERVKYSGVESMPLLSRADPADPNRSLRNLSIQKELWEVMQKKFNKAMQSNDMKEWEMAIADLRKLREAVFATMEIYNELSLVKHVFEWSVIASLRGNNPDELHKCFSRLVEEIYVKYPALENSYFTSLYVLYLACIKKNFRAVNEMKNRLSSNNPYNTFTKNAISCIDKKFTNSFKYFQLHKHAPSPDHAALLREYDDEVRIQALNIMRKAYLSASVNWIEYWLGVANQNKDIELELKRLNQMDCIKSFDKERQIIYFLKKRVH